jgi:hypothetical protein
MVNDKEEVVFDESTGEITFEETVTPDEETQEQEVEVTETEQEPEKTDKFDGKSEEEIRRSYRELEKKLGEQGRELGELRKKVTQPENTGKKSIDALSDDELQNTVEYVESLISKPNAQLEDDDYGANLVLYNKLNRELGKREAGKVISREKASTINEKAVMDFAKYCGDTLSGEQLAKVTEGAIRLSDSGTIGDQQLRASLLNAYPDVFEKIVLKRTTSKKVDEAKEAAKLTGQPRVDQAGNSAVVSRTVITPEELAKLQQNNPEKFRRIIDKLTPEQITKLMEKNKKG